MLALHRSQLRVYADLDAILRGGRDVALALCRASDDTRFLVWCCSEIEWVERDSSEPLYPIQLRICVEELAAVGVGGEEIGITRPVEGAENVGSGAVRASVDEGESSQTWKAGFMSTILTASALATAERSRMNLPGQATAI